MRKKILHILEYWIVCILYGLFYIMPIDIASWVGGKLGECAGLISKSSNTAMKNLTFCYPDKSEEWKKNIIRDMWNNLGRMVAEIPHWKNATKEMSEQRIKIVNKPEQLATRGLFLAGHFANFELASIISKELELGINLVYRPANNPFVDNLISQSRLAHGVKLIKKGKAGVREVIRALENDERAFIGMLVDQKTNDGIDVPFFGAMVKTTPFPANLAKKYNLPVIMVRFERTSGANYIVAFEKIINYKKTANTDLIMKEINETLERWIKASPSQWFWVHKRWSR